MFIERKVCNSAVLLVTICLLVVFDSDLAGQVQFKRARQRPNIILINLDDADSRLLADEILDAYYPNISALASSGIRFTNLHATTPFCGPSRAALMRGQYAFGTRIRNNQPTLANSNGFPGSYAEFLEQNHHFNELGYWLKQAGYHTIHVGKFHHAGFNEEVPPGWCDVALTGGAFYFNNYRFTNIFDPKGDRAATGKDVYVTHLDRDDSIYFVDQHLFTNPHKPFFLYVAPLAPHLPTGGNPLDMVEPKYEDLVVPALPMPPNFAEADMSDKPIHYQNIRELRESDITRFIGIHEGRARSMKSVDDMLGGILSSLEPCVRDNTWIFFTSDNGFLLGEHNMLAKQFPYNESTSVPLIVSGPTTKATAANHLLAHIDICPTILELAKVPIPKTVDAKSFLPLLADPNAYLESKWQTEIMIENTNNKNMIGQNLSTTYTALRMYDSIYIGWANGESEYYDLNDDPFQLDNSFANLPESEKDTLRSRLRNFRQRAVDPFSSVSFPLNGSAVNASLVVEGFCEDDRACSDTFLQIYNATADVYWNGMEWQDAMIELQVNSAVTDRPLARWNTSYLLYNTNSSGIDCLQIKARSLDIDENMGGYSTEIDCVLDTLDPEIVYDKAFENGMDLPSGAVLLMGESSDNLQVRCSEVSIVDVNSNLFWNGTEFQTDPIWLAMEQFDTDWSVLLDLPVGSYCSAVRCFDTAGNESDLNVLCFHVVD